MTTLDNAIARIQDIALAMTTVSIKSAPDYPVENADPFPMVASYVGGGQFNFGNADTLFNFPNITVEFHFARTNIRQTEKDIRAVVLEFPKRLAGDPTLNGIVSTVIGGGENRISYTRRPFAWGQVTSEMLLFTIPIKIMDTPQATA